MAAALTRKTVCNTTSHPARQAGRAVPHCIGFPKPNISVRMNKLRIISGGQTGVDRGALDAAMELGIEHGGKCPQGRLAEDGTIPRKYQLKELPSRRYSVRTEQNVIESDATLILHYGELSGGTEFTRRMAIKNAKPYFLYDLTQPAELDEVLHWLADEQVGTLNCAGPRESSCPGIQSLARQLCRELFARATAASTDAPAS